MAYIEPITGRYVHVELDDVAYRTYFEENGSGVPLVCLHTAGADQRQYRHLLVDDDVTDDFRVIAFDLPWHGNSLPPGEWWNTEYKLTQRFYLDFIAAFCGALELDRPILLGCSMGGYVMLDIAYDQPGDYRALIAVAARAYAPEWAALKAVADDPEIDHHSWMAISHSCSAPTSPEQCRRETDWIYASNGPGVVAGDLYYAAEDHDARPFLSEIDLEATGLHVIGGDWDLSCLPQHTEELQRRAPGLPVTRMSDTGHFSPAENPESFKRVLMPILEPHRPAGSG